MSLFNETVARAARAEQALDDAQKRIANLEIALKTAHGAQVRLSEARYGKRDYSEREIPGKRVTSNHNELNTLSERDVEEMFKAKMAEQADAGDLKSPAEKRNGSIPFLGTIARLLQKC